MCSFISFNDKKDLIVVKTEIELGHFIFFDKELSYNQSISCSTCHSPELAFSDGYKVSVNFEAQSLKFNSPSLINVGSRSFFSWTDTTITNLSTVLERSLYGTDPIEHGLFLNENVILENINKKYLYKADSLNETIDINLVKTALVSYLNKLESRRSPRDSYLKNSNSLSYTDEMKKGEKIFQKMECHNCHGGIDFDQPESGLNVADFNNEIAKYNNSNGLFYQTKKGGGENLFRIPSLRNLCFTAPYMHDGSAVSLNEAIDFHYTYMEDKRLLQKSFDENEKSLLMHYIYSICDHDFFDDPLFNDPH